MRTWGRNAQGQWIEISTTATGDNSEVWLTTFAQSLKLNLGESPFYGTYGIPAQSSIQNQTAPDYYVSLMQQAFAPYFIALSTQRTSGSNGEPIYNITALLNNGSIVNAEVPS